MKIKMDRRQKATIILAAMLLLLNFAMRNGVWRRMQRINLEKTRYEKLALAYKLGGLSGIDYELGIIAKYDPLATGFVNKVSTDIRKSKDAGLFLKSAMREDREKISRLRAGRAIISAIIVIVITGRVMLIVIFWLKDNKDEVSAYLQKIYRSVLKT